MMRSINHLLRWLLICAGLGVLASGCAVGQTDTVPPTSTPAAATPSTITPSLPTLTSLPLLSLLLLLEQHFLRCSSSTARSAH